MPVLCTQHISAYLSIQEEQGRGGGRSPPPLPCSFCMLRYAEICWVAWAAWALADYSMANRKIAYTLGRGRAYIFDMSSTSGYMDETYFRNLVPYFLTCPQLVDTWVKHIFRNLVPDFWRVMLFLACHVLNVACHGVSISIVSIISVSCRVRILRVSMFMPCRGHLDMKTTKPCASRTFPNPCDPKK